MPDQTVPDHDQPHNPPVEGPIEANAVDGDSDRLLHRTLERAEDGRWVLGVCTGIRDVTGWSVWLPRLAFVALTPVFGLGALLYLILAVSIPHQHDGRSILGRVTDDIDRPSQWLGAAAAILGGMLLLAVATGLSGEAVVALGLIATGVLLFQVRPAAERPPRPPRAARVHDDIDDLPAVPRRRREHRPPPPPRERSQLTALTVAACLLVLAVMSALHFAEAVAIGSVHYLGAATITVSLGLLVGSRWGRSRVLVVVALGLIPLTGLAFMLDNAAGAAETFYGVDTVEQISFVGVAPESVSRNAARLRVDLTGAEWPQSGEYPHSIRLDVGVGDITLVLPADVMVHGRVRFGLVDIPGVRAERGMDIGVWAPGPDWESAAGEVYVRTGWGRVVIERSAA